VQKIETTERWFQKTGVWIVFLSRITPYVRPFACFPAGISRMPFGRFFLAALVGSTIWCVVMLNVGLALGHRWLLALHLIRHYTVPTLCTLALLVVLYFVIASALRRYLRAQAESIPDALDSVNDDLSEKASSTSVKGPGRHI